FYYHWVLDKFGKDAKITEWCFDDILEARINVDIYVQQNQNQDALNESPENNFKDIIDVFNKYSDTKNFFKPSHLKIIKQATHVDIIDRLKNCLGELESDDYLDEMNILTSTNKRRRDDQELNVWYNEIKKLHDSSMSDEFIESVESFLVCEVDEIDNQREYKKHKLLA
ncbi:5406_t:CDS:1, partial [Scutellospora calospora]